MSPLLKCVTLRGGVAGRAAGEGRPGRWSQSEGRQIEVQGGWKGREGRLCEKVGGGGDRGRRGSGRWGAGDLQEGREMMMLMMIMLMGISLLAFVDMIGPGRVSWVKGHERRGSSQGERKKLFGEELR